MKKNSEEIPDQRKTEARQLHAAPCLVSKGLDDLVLQVLLAITCFSLGPALLPLYRSS